MSVAQPNAMDEWPGESHGEVPHVEMKKPDARHLEAIRRIKKKRRLRILSLHKQQKGVAQDRVGAMQLRSPASPETHAMFQHEIHYFCDFATLGPTSLSLPAPRAPIRQNTRALEAGGEVFGTPVLSVSVFSLNSATLQKQDAPVSLAAPEPLSELIDDEEKSQSVVLDGVDELPDELPLPFSDSTTPSPMRKPAYASVCAPCPHRKRGVARASVCTRRQLSPILTTP